MSVRHTSTFCSDSHASRACIIACRVLVTSSVCVCANAVLTFTYFFSTSLFTEISIPAKISKRFCTNSNLNRSCVDTGFLAEWQSMNTVRVQIIPPTRSSSSNIYNDYFAINLDHLILCVHRFSNYYQTWQVSLSVSSETLSLSLSLSLSLKMSSSSTKKKTGDDKLVATINDQLLLLNPSLSRQLRRTKKFIIQEHYGTIDAFLLPTTTTTASKSSTTNGRKSKGRHDSHGKDGDEDDENHGHHFSIDSSTIQKLLRTVDRRHIHKTYNVYTSSSSSSSSTSNSSTQQLLCKVIEESQPGGITGRNCCDPFHKLKLHALFNRTEDEKTSLHIVYDRPYKFGGYCCQPREIRMSYFNKKDIRILGKIQEATPCSRGIDSCLYPKFYVDNRSTTAPTTTDRMDRGDDTDKDDILHTTATIQSRSCCCIGGICCDEAFDVRSITGSNKKKSSKIGTVMTSYNGRSEGNGGGSGGVVFYVKQDVSTIDKLSLLGGVHLLQYTFLDRRDKNVSSRSRCGAKFCDMYCCGCIVPCQCDCDGNACIPAGM